jgi:hypothetical protein
VVLLVALLSLSLLLEQAVRTRAAVRAARIVFVKVFMVKTSVR